MRILLINLAKDVERLTFSRRQFAQQGLEFERLEATNGRELSQDEYDAFIASRPRDGKRQWTRGKVGCFLSHSRAWKICAEGPDDWIAIVEDDLRVSNEFRHFVTDPTWMPTDFDIIRLEKPTNRIKLDKQPASVHHGRGTYRLYSTSWCAGSYILSKKGAQKLLSVPEKYHENPDRFMFCHEDSIIAGSLNTYQVAPSLTTQDKYDSAKPTFASNIETPDIVSTDRITLMDKITHLSPQEIFLVIKKTLQGYRRVNFKP